MLNGMVRSILIIIDRHGNLSKLYLEFEFKLVGIEIVECINIDGIGRFEEFEFPITTITATTYTSTTDDFYHKLVHAETPHTHTIQVPQLYD